MKPVLVRPAAAADIEDAYSWYETQRPGLGDEFREALRHALIKSSIATRVGHCSNDFLMVSITESFPR